MGIYCGDALEALTCLRIGHVMKQGGRAVEFLLRRFAATDWEMHRGEVVAGMLFGIRMSRAGEQDDDCECGFHWR